MADDVTRERYDTILRLRREGLTFREIAEKMGVSTSRASQMHARALAVEATMFRWSHGEPTVETPVDHLKLRDRTYRALLAGGYRTLGDLLPLDDQKQRDLLRLLNFGRSCLVEIKSVIGNL